MFNPANSKLVYTMNFVLPSTEHELLKMFWRAMSVNRYNGIYCNYRNGKKSTVLIQEKLCLEDPSGLKPQNELSKYRKI